MRIGIIGHFGGNEVFTDGQTVKVMSLYEGLSKRIPKNVKIDKVDTYYLKHGKMKLGLSLIKCIFFDKTIIFLPATNGRKVLFKLMHFIRVIFNKDVYHDCIGGALVKELSENPQWKKYLNGFKANWMESQIQASKLREMGIHNAEYLPNFKNIEPLKESALKMKFDYPLRFCTFSRILPEKGIEDAANAVLKANKAFGSNKAILDIYGPIQNGCEEWFKGILENYGDAVVYHGAVDSLQSVDVLKNYYALLFPTRYYTEGMPGTIIDAMFSGVPVISRRWAYCDQVIKNEYNGLSYDFGKPEILNEIIVACINSPSQLINMRCNCLLEAQKYTEKYVVDRILAEILND